MMKWTSQDLHWQNAVRGEGGRVLVLPNQTDKLLSCGLGVTSLLHKHKFVGFIPARVDRFSGGENRRQACHLIMWEIKYPLSINLVLVLREN
ncbi:hypothetical protein TNCV_452171 [Trichonephila clavipes]|nr:hypothetical protein TNCV_452171 [Trichonephila clavipes]